MNHINLRSLILGTLVLVATLLVVAVPPAGAAGASDGRGAGTPARKTELTPRGIVPNSIGAVATGTQPPPPEVVRKFVQLYRSYNAIPEDNQPTFLSWLLFNGVHDQPTIVMMMHLYIIAENA